MICVFDGVIDLLGGTLDVVGVEGRQCYVTCNKMVKS